MKKILLSAIAVLAFSLGSYAQDTKTKVEKKTVQKVEKAEKKTTNAANKVVKEEKVTKVEEKKLSVDANGNVLKKDGTIDKRYNKKVNLKKDGTPDRRYKENKTTTTTTTKTTK